MDTYDEDEIEVLKMKVEDYENDLEDCHAEIRRLRTVIREMKNEKGFNIPLNDGHSIRVEANPDHDYKEVCVGIVEDDTNTWVQDLCVVREAYTNEDGKAAPNSGVYEVLVYANIMTEDYTDAFIIPLFREPEPR